jgi:catalase
MTFFRNSSPVIFGSSRISPAIWDETVKISGADPDFHHRDMFEAMAAGIFPEWEFAVQLFTQEEVDRFPFDHPDATKLIPEEQAV